MTVAEANSLSADALAARLLGIADDHPFYVEKRVFADIGGPANVVGLSGIELAKAPKATPYPGLCEIDGSYVSFETPPAKQGEDSPHRVRRVQKFERFLVIDTSQAGMRQPDMKAMRTCTSAGPIFAGRQPRAFYVEDDGGAQKAYFALAALRRIRAKPLRGAKLLCRPNPADTADLTCHDPAKTIRKAPLEAINAVRVGTGDGHVVVDISWSLGFDTRGEKRLGLHLVTDARHPDPSQRFTIANAKLGMETWVE
jgi:hypothetical protein